MSRRQRLVFLESVPSFVRCFSGALTAPNTGCHRKQTNIHLFHSFSWHWETKEQRNSKRDDDGTSPWVAAGASTVASCYSDVETGKQQNVWRTGDSVMFGILPLRVWWTFRAPPGLVKARLFFLYFRVSPTARGVKGVLHPAPPAHWLRMRQRLTTFNPLPQRFFCISSQGLFAFFLL